MGQAEITWFTVTLGLGELGLRLDGAPAVWALSPNGKNSFKKIPYPIVIRIITKS